MRFEIKTATTEKTKSGTLQTFGIAQRQGGNGTQDVPGGGGKEYVLFKLNHREVERETWNKQARNFQKLQRQTARLIEKYGLQVCRPNKPTLELKHRTKKY